MDALGDLEARLAERGLRLGVDDRVRLRLVDRAFLGEPSHRDALAAVVVKQREERGLFEEVYDAWARHRAPPTVDTPAPPPVTWVPTDTPVEDARRRVRAWVERRKRRIVLAGLLLAAVLVALHLAPEPDESIAVDTPDPVDTDTPPDPIPPTPKTTFDPLTGTRMAWVPRFGEPIPAQGSRRWDLLVLSVCALVGLGVATWIVRVRRELPDPPQPPPPLPPPPARPAPTALLLDRADQEALGWGISQHAADEPTPELDIDRTIQATAANAGIPTLRHRRRRAPLGAWLWVDRPGTKALRRFADEVRATLEDAGLPVRTSDFHGLPDKLADDEAGPLRLQDIPADARRARVLALTDGVAWAARVDGTPAGTQIPTLDDLRTWDHLTVVDFGAPPLLPARLAPWRIPVVPPEQAVEALSGEARRSTSAPAALARWEELCALGGERVTPDVALGLRAESGLDVPPWWVQNVLGGLPRRLNPGDRAALLRRAAEALGVQREKPLDGARVVPLPPTFQSWLGAWRRLRPGSPDPSGPDPDRGVFLAALQLWDDPWAAIPALYGWTQRGEGSRVRAAVGHLAPADARAGESATILPWRAADLDAELHPLLAAIGLGADAAWVPEGQVRQPSRREIGRWVLVGAALGAALGFVLAGRGALPETQVIVEGESPPLTEVRCAPGEDTDVCRAASVSEVARIEVPKGARVPLRWEWAELPCYTDEGGGRTWRCGPEGEPPRPEGRPERVSVHVTKALRGEVESLALELLKGTADVVTANGEDLRDGLGAVHVVMNTEAGAELSRLREGVSSFAGLKPAREVDGWRTQLDAGVVRPVGQGAADDGALLLFGTAPPPPPPVPVVPVSARIPEPVPVRVPVDVVVQAASPDPPPTPTVPEVAAPPATESPAVPDVAPPATARCGNGTVDPGEDCDGGKDCRPDCGLGPAVSWTELVWVTIPAGKGVIGTKDATNYVGPQWEVTIPRPFQMTATEVTNAQYRGATGGREDQLPAVRVNWADAKAFCERKGGRLPTEVEWEYAARAGSEGLWSFGDEASRLPEFAWYDENSEGEAHPVATRRPNRWGLYDMHGNAWEWVEDTYDPNAWTRYRDDAALRDTLSPIVDGSGRVVRGGSFEFTSRDTRSALRFDWHPSLEDGFLGFRCVLASRPQP